MKYLPDEAFNIQTEESIDNGNSIDKVNTQEVMVSYDEDYQLKLAENMRYLIEMVRSKQMNSVAWMDFWSIEIHCILITMSRKQERKSMF